MNTVTVVIEKRGLKDANGKAIRFNVPVDLDAMLQAGEQKSPGLQKSYLHAVASQRIRQAISDGITAASTLEEVTAAAQAVELTPYGAIAGSPANKAEKIFNRLTKLSPEEQDEVKRLLAQRLQSAPRGAQPAPRS